MGEHEVDEAVDGEPVPTVRERLRAAQLSDGRVQNHLQAGAVALDGTVVTDLDTPAPRGSRMVFTGR